MSYTICIDAGHGGKDPGAVNSTDNAYKEKDAALSISLLLGSILMSKGYTVAHTRYFDTYLALKDRCEVSNSSNAKAFVSIHLNSSTNKTASGIEVLRYSSVGSNTKSLATNVQNNLIKSLGWKNRGVKERDNLYVLKHTICSAILVECGFISNDEERDKLFNTVYQLKIANAIADGVISVFG